MSTRSGKRIHNSFHENILKSDVEQIVDSSRKTRSKRFKENVEELSVTTLKSKKRANYVSYPSEDDMVDCKVEEDKSTRLLRKTTLKDNVVPSSTESEDLPTNLKKVIRTTRRTRKFPEDAQEEMLEIQNHVESINTVEFQNSKEKKGKKKKHLAEEVNKEIVISKKKPKKKKGYKVRRSGSMVVEDIELESGKKNIDKNNMSIDSYHSAAGSPLKVCEDFPFDMVQSPPKESKALNISFKKNDIDEAGTDVPDVRTTRSARLSSINTPLKTPITVVKGSRKRKSSVKELDSNTNNETFGKKTKIDENRNTPSTKVSKKQKSSSLKPDFKEQPANTTINNDVINSTYDLEDLEKRKSIINTTLDKNGTSDKINGTYDKDTTPETKKSTVVDTTFDKNSLSADISCDNEPEIIAIGPENKRQSRRSIINTTFEKIDLDVKSMEENAIINTTFDKDSGDAGQGNNIRKSINNSTFDKDTPSEIHSETINDGNRKSMCSQNLATEMNSTFDKVEIPDSTFEKEKNLDATFDKISKSSLITSDNSTITIDKSDVRISITSDDSQENIVNTTPVLIESSMDESQTNASRNCLKSPATTPATPLKREGTFTKESPEFVESPTKVYMTPTKRMSLPSPGSTPFPNKTVSKEKIVFDVTQSIDKSRRSSVAELPLRATKVMFCSPVNNPAVVLQQRRKVIKSNLKGSNKSFVFEENAATESRRAPRKRSYTQSDADNARVKRKRLADGLQNSVDRLSRPRTSSASAKLGEPSTPSKKAPKKDAKISRTKLPNFAALHQKQFDNMESLGECQERKAKRAKQLLTPTGAITVLGRTSPNEAELEPQKSPNDPSPEVPREQKKEKQRPKEPVKPETPVKSLPTLKSLNPGYTRFGFKLNLDVNPFSIQSKNVKNVSDSFSFTTKKESKAKSSLFGFSSKKHNTKPLKEIKPNSRHTTVPSVVPSVAGATSVRKEIAKQTIMREKSFTDKRNVNRKENRTVIKGVRTNRRFELQMRMRNLD